MAFEVMYDDIEVAYLSDDRKEYILRENIPRKYIPPGLFENLKSEHSEIVIEYFCSRVFPRERTDCKQVLKTLGLRRYDPWLIVKANNATLPTDSWWMKINPTDNYYDNTVRGLIGFPPASEEDNFHQEPRKQNKD